MRDFKYGNRSRGGRDGRRAELHDAVCDKCGNDCKVPFRPSGEKPIYCSDCFEGQGGRDRGRSGGGGRRSFGDRGSSRSSGGGASTQSIEKLTKSIEALNTKLGKIVEFISSKEKSCCGGDLPDKKKSKVVKVKKEKK